MLLVVQAPPTSNLDAPHTCPEGGTISMLCSQVALALPGGSTA
jgi:hypothetical protein